MRRTLWRSSICSMVCGLLFIGAAETSLAKGVLNVGSNGVDSPACGDQDTPCRSISQAIANASDGEGIVVGPGLYGDLNGDGDFLDPGDEAAGPGPSGTTCLINLNKSLEVESSEGAAVTIINANLANLANAPVVAACIQANGVVFGKKQHGFTITNSRSFGLLLDGNVMNVTVAGNLATNNGLNGNDAFLIQGTGHIITGNVAIGNARFGFGIFGSDYVVTDNVSSGNLGGFSLGFTGRFSDNVVSGNRFDGLTVDANVPRLEISRNAIISNRQFGIRGGGTENNLAITENNIFGNGTIAENCGVLNNLGPVGPMMAPHNFWGDASGPGPDPADTVCEVTGSVTIVEPFATKAFNIVVKEGL